MIAGQRRGHRHRERGFGLGLLVGQHPLQVGGHHAKRRRIGPRRGERQVDQLEHRLDVAARGAAAQPFLGVGDIRAHGGVHGGQRLVQVGPVETTEPAFRDHFVGGEGGHEIAIRGERGPARTDGPEQHLVGLEVGRLEHHARAIRQPPLGDAERVDRRRAGDLARRRQRVEERRLVHDVNVGRECAAAGLGDRCRQRRRGRRGETGALGRVDDDHAVAIGQPGGRQLVDLFQA